MSRILNTLALFDSSKFNIPKTAADNSQIEVVLNFVLTLAGGIAILIIVLGGIQYITSQGESGKVAKAKDTILYAVIGLVLVITAQILVRFVVGKLV